MSMIWKDKLDHIRNDLFAIDNCIYTKKVWELADIRYLFLHVCDPTSLHIKDENGFKKDVKVCNDFHKEEKREKFIQRRVNVYIEWSM